MVRTGSETSGRSETGSWPSDTAPTSTKASVAATVVTGRRRAPLASDIYGRREAAEPGSRREAAEPGSRREAAEPGSRREAAELSSRREAAKPPWRPRRSDRAASARCGLDVFGGRLMGGRSDARFG